MEQRRINVRGIVWKDNKILAVKHKTSDGSETDYWAIPGGGLDSHEALEAGMKRELMEETGVSAHVGKLLFTQQFAQSTRRDKESLEFFFHIENPDDFLQIDLSSTTHGDDEIAHIEFIDPAREILYPPFLSEISFEDYITGNKPVYLYTEL